MDATIGAKVNTWLTGNYDETTKAEIKKLQTENENELADAFYRNLNLVPAACVASWVLVPTV